MKKTAAILTILAGLLHATYVAIEHWSEFPQLEFGFFISIGIAQMLWGAWFMRNETSTAKLYSGLALNSSILISWLLTRTVRAPFQEGVEAIGVLDSFMAIMELTVVLILSTHILKKANQALTALMTIIAITIAGGGGLYGSSLVMELIFPDRVFVHTHGKTDTENTPHMLEDDHGHDEEDSHN